MQIQLMNVEAGVFRALKAYKVETGSSDADATRWATANLSEGVSRVKGVLDRHKRDPEGGVDAAFAALKVWAQSS
jgi:hypothetical protein